MIQLCSLFEGGRELCNLLGADSTKVQSLDSQVGYEFKNKSYTLKRKMDFLNSQVVKEATGAPGHAPNPYLNRV